MQITFNFAKIVQSMRIMCVSYGVCYFPYTKDNCDAKNNNEIMGHDQHVLENRDDFLLLLLLLSSYNYLFKDRKTSNQKP